MKAVSASAVPQEARPVSTQARGVRYVALAGAFVVVLAFFLAFVTPWYQTWGTTSEEQHMTLPGDQFAVGGLQETRAITIDAPVSSVWPWLSQLGQDRGGFYSYDLLENLVGCKMPTSDYLRFDKGIWRAGDKLWMYPPERGVKISGAPLQTYIPGRALGFATTQNTYGDSSWNFVLQPIDSGHTRFLVRGIAPPSSTLTGTLFNLLVFNPAHFVMEKRMMIGIKQLSEGSDRGRIWNHMQVMLWVVVFGLWVASVVFVLRRSEWIRPLIGFFAASALFQILTLGQPSVWLGLVLVGGLAWLIWPSRPAAPRRYGLTPAPPKP